MCNQVRSPHCHGHGHDRGSCGCGCMNVLSIEDEIKSLEIAKQHMQEKLKMTEQKIDDLRKLV